MVKILEQNNNEVYPAIDNGWVYQCEECGLKYKEKEIAEKCERWCSEHKSCNLEIIKYAVPEREENAPEASKT